MRTTFLKLFCLLTIGVLMLSSCNMPGGNATTDVTPQVQPSATRIPATSAPTATPTELLPTETATLTPTETPIPEPSDTATPEPVTAEVARESNCRIGPAGNYDLVAKYPIGQKLEVVGRDLGNGYLIVKNPDQPEEQCYLLANNVTIIGDVSSLPQFSPPPSPTAAPYFNVTFKKFDVCKGADFALFVVQNTGSVPFRSFYIKVTDQKNSKFVEQVLNAFDLRVGCVLAKNIAPLDPGAEGYVTSPPFSWNATGDKLRAVIMLCTEKALKGVCITQSVDIKP